MPNDLLVLQIGNEGMIHFIIIHDDPIPLATHPFPQRAPVRWRSIDNFEVDDHSPNVDFRFRLYKIPAAVRIQDEVPVLGPEGGIPLEGFQWKIIWKLRWVRGTPISGHLEFCIQYLEMQVTASFKLNACRV